MPDGLGMPWPLRASMERVPMPGSRRWRRGESECRMTGAKLVCAGRCTRDSPNPRTFPFARRWRMSWVAKTCEGWQSCNSAVGRITHDSHGQLSRLVILQEAARAEAGMQHGHKWLKPEERERQRLPVHNAGPIDDSGDQTTMTRQGRTCWAVPLSRRQTIGSRCPEQPRALRAAKRDDEESTSQVDAKTAGAVHYFGSSSGPSSSGEGRRVRFSRPRWNCLKLPSFQRR